MSQDNAIFLSATGLRTDRRTAPLGTDNPTPEFSWLITAPDDGRAAQVAYLIEVSSSPDFGADTVWHSGRVESALPYGAQYQGPPLRSRSRYHWRVRLVDAHGRCGVWSEPAWFETAVLDPGLWSAQWISAAPRHYPTRMRPYIYAVRSN